MARADARTLGLLNRWPTFLHEDYWRFNQILGTGVRISPECQNNVYIQYERQYIADSLVEAVGKMAEYLGYWPAPTWVTDDVLTINEGLPWNGQKLSTSFGHLTEFGKRATAEIAADLDATYSDTDSDTVKEKATIAVLSGVADIPVEEIQVFFREVDGAPGEADEYWQVEGLTVKKVGDTAEITGPRWLFVKPSIWAKEYQTGTMQKFNGITTTDADFVAKVDVHRVYADPTNAVQLLLNAGQVSSANAVVNATAAIQDAELGNFAIYTGDGQTAPSWFPNKVRVSYRAGYPLDRQGGMDKQFALAATKYANTLMPQQPQMCDRTLSMWSEDAQVSPNLAARNAWTPPPFGITNGGLYAWGVVMARRMRLKAREWTGDKA